MSSFRVRSALARCAVLLALTGAGLPTAADPQSRLVWHVETLEGLDVESRGADAPVNPASVVKVAVTLRALERLGPAHRFETRFVTDGVVDEEAGVLRGDLVVVGAADPDFHPENAFLVAAALNAAGLERVEGTLKVDERFWIGWEGGSAGGPLPDPDRSRKMADRLRKAWDPARWDRNLRTIWAEFGARRGMAAGAEPPRVVVDGGVAVTDGDETPERALAVHRSNPLARILKRLNSYSNNDIERLEPGAGSAAQIARDLAERLGLPADAVRFDTLSGLGTNRLTPRGIVRLLRELHAACGRLGIRVEDVLPVGGCDPGTLERFASFREGGVAVRSLTGKTGTLTTTDGGVSLLVGYLSTAAGERVICVALPNSGYGVRAARRAQEAWLLERLTALGGARPRDCGAPVVHSDFEAEVVVPLPAAQSLRRS